MEMFAPNERLEAEVQRSPNAAVFQGIRAKVGAEGSPFTVIVTMKIEPEAAARFAAAFVPAIAFSRTEDGCQAYDLNQSVDDRASFVLYERWSSLDALRAHMISDEYLQLLDQVGSMLKKIEVSVLAPYAE